MSQAIFPLSYLAPVSHYALMLEYTEVLWDIHEFFHKQNLYNRCVIYGPNGAQKLIIPIHKKYEKTPLKDIEIGYESPWQRNHWRSFEAAYRRSPYFEFYEDELYPIYMEYHPKLLLDWNLKIVEVICKMVKININMASTKEYYTKSGDISDFRYLALPNFNQNIGLPKYNQVFEERHGFIPNLSIADLIFCEGPHTIDYLQINR